MGIFDFFTGGKGGKIGKVVARANNKDSQSADRFAALEQLRDDESDEAIGGLLRRFSFVYSKSIEDEQEKEWVHDTLVAMGERILGPLQKSLIGAETISWQLKVLNDVAEHEKAWSVLERVIEANDNQYARDPSRKVQLINFIGEGFPEERAARALIQYLEDMDETVRFTAVEALFNQKQEEVAREPLLKLLLSPEEESLRIKFRILDGLADLAWPAEGHKGALEAYLASLDRPYSIDAKGRVKKPQK